MTQKNSRIGLRIPEEDVKLVRQVCNSRREDVSDFVRRAIRSELARLSFLKPVDKKALGITKRGD